MKKFVRSSIIGIPSSLKIESMDDYCISIFNTADSMGIDLEMVLGSNGCGLSLGHPLEVFECQPLNPKLNTPLYDPF